MMNGNEHDRRDEARACCDADKGNTAGLGRPTYERPAITFRETLEVMAGICSNPGKQSGYPACKFVSS